MPGVEQNAIFLNVFLSTCLFSAANVLPTLLLDGLVSFMAFREKKEMRRAPDEMAVEAKAAVLPSTSVPLAAAGSGSGTICDL